MRPLLFLILSSLMIHVVAQNPRDIFEKSKLGQSNSFQQFKAKNDSAFAKFIADSWQKFNLKEPLSFEKEDRPIDKPIFQDGSLNDLIFQGLPEDTAIIMRSFSPEPFESPDYFPEIREIGLSFYGAGITVKYPNGFFDTKIEKKGRDALIDFWLSLGKKGYIVLVEDLIALKSQYKLPDYGFYLLVRSAIKKAIDDPVREIYYTWFILNKASFVCKIGYADGKPILLLGTNGKIYNRPYYQEDGIYFYAVEGVVGELYTYGNPTVIQLKTFDLSVKEPIELPLSAVSRKVTFDYLETAYELEIWYNKHASSLLEKFPPVDIRYSFQSTASRLTFKSLEKSLQPIIQNMNQIQRVNFLLSFVQNGFEYQSDKQQFGEEKVMYPDEFLSYEHSDCDDRVVFLSYLLRAFTELEMVAVLFPQHVALAVQLPGPIYGESVLFQGKKYTFCDPTYFNAPLGAVIPEADKSKARILKIP